MDGVGHCGSDGASAVAQRIGLDRIWALAADDGSVTEEQVRLGLYRDDPWDLDAPPSMNSWVSRYVAYGATQVGSNIAYHLATGLVLLAQSAPAVYVVKRTFVAPTRSNIWCLCVGYSGQDQKSLAVAELGHAILGETRVDRVAADPASEEALVRSMQANPVQALIYDEFSNFLSATAGNTIANYRAKIPDAMTKIFDGHPIKRGRAKGRTFCERPRLSMLAACTPIHIEALTDQPMWEGGFMSRFTFFYAHSERTVYVGEDRDDEREALKDQLSEWMDWSHRDEGLVRCSGMSQDTQDLWQAWCADFAKRTRNVLPSLQGVASRIPLMAAKVSCLLAWDIGMARCVEYDQWEMYPHFILPAIRIAELSWQSANAVAQNIAPSLEARMKRTVLHAIDEDGWWTAMGTVMDKAGMLKRTAYLCLDSLREEGKVEGVTGPTGTLYWRRIPGGKPTPYLAPVDAAVPPPVGEEAKVLPFPVGAKQTKE